MRNFELNGKIALALAATAATLGCLPTASASLLVDYKAANYNPTTGIWLDSSGNGDNAAVATTFSSKPTMTANATPNGSSAVTFNGSTGFVMTRKIASSSGYTAFAFLEPATTSGDQGIVGGDSGNFYYRLANGQQAALVDQARDLANGSAVLPTSSFSNINVASDGTNDSTGTTFRFNGAADGSAGASDTFANGVYTVGYGIDTGFGTGGAGAKEFFTGQIAEIQVYSGVLTTAQRQAVEQSFINAYVTPEPATLSLMTMFGAGLLLRNCRRRGPV